MKSNMADLGTRLQAAAAAAASEPYPQDRFDGRGIVICAGGARLFTCAWIAIGVLRRHLGSTLPIEVWHLGPAEMGPPMRGLLEELDAQPVDAHEVAKHHPVDRLGGWELKPYALMHSRFREVLLLDADNVPVKDPSFLFDRQEFVDAGALFWPENFKLSEDNKIWELAGLAYHDILSVESGQIVLDKSKCWPALCLAHWMNQHSDEFYRIIYGDKDTFLIAWLMLEQAFHLIRHPPKLLDFTLCQRDPDGGVLFQHRSGAKWILHGSNPKIAGFRLEPECRALLKELAGRWDGRVFNPPARSREARRWERALSRTRRFTRHRVSSDERQIELAADHSIRGGELAERYWHVADSADGPELRIEANGLPCCALRRSADGIWRGRLLEFPGTPVELVPADADAVDTAPPVERDAAGATALLDPILQLAAALPWDREVARDIVGALRVLAALDPAFIARLEEEAECAASMSGRAQIARAALTGLADCPRRPDAGGIATGHGWRTGPFIGPGYDV
jgi:hypothetical protein